MNAGFARGKQRWRARQPRRGLDVGCGQGTQLLRLARTGHHTTGLDSSATLLTDLDTALAAEPDDVRQRVRTVLGDAENLTDLFASASFDVVLCHGVLMYFPDPHPLLAALARAVCSGGVV